MKQIVGVVQRAVKENIKRLEGKRAEVMEVGVHSATSFICVAGDSVMIHFPRKRYLFVSTTRAIRTRDRGAEKFGGLKDFEVRGIRHYVRTLKWRRTLTKKGDTRSMRL
jgi:hypothetical protein